MFFWKRLKKISRLTFYAKTQSKEDNNRNVQGEAKVILIRESSHRLIFHETGDWKSTEGQEFRFRNVLRWTLDLKTGVISLEHLRRGPDHPVFLVHLTPFSKNCLSCIHPHACGTDTYFGRLDLARYTLRLRWRITGPKKKEKIDYFYS